MRACIHDRWPLVTGTGGQVEDATYNTPWLARLPTIMMNLLGYKYKIYNSGYNTDMINKQCNAGDPLESPGGLYR